jgi:zinc D-Ala-D-Ala dipeptidase
VPEAPALINDARVVAIPIQECGQPMVSLAGSGLVLVSDDGEADQNADQYRCRSGIRDRLIRAQTKLPHGFVLGVSECFRPLSLQAQYWERTLARMRNQYPDWNDQQLASEAAKFIAPPWIVPPHSTGGAVDVVLIDAAGSFVEMGSALDVHCPEMMTESPLISAAAQQNRRMLRSAMESAEFVNYDHEWWHYSFGDRYWAFKTDAAHALYDAQ